MEFETEFVHLALFLGGEEAGVGAASSPGGGCCGGARHHGGVVGGGAEVVHNSNQEVDHKPRFGCCQIFCCRMLEAAPAMLCGRREKSIRTQNVEIWYDFNPLNLS